MQKKLLKFSVSFRKYGTSHLKEEIDLGSAYIPLSSSHRIFFSVPSLNRSLFLFAERSTREEGGKERDGGKKFTYRLESKLDCANSQKSLFSDSFWDAVALFLFFSS